MTAPLILLVMVIAQLADAVSFVIGVAKFGISYEANPFARVVYDAAGLDGVIMAKGAVVLIVLAVLTAAARRFPRVLVLGGATATSIGLLGFLANFASIALA